MGPNIILAPERSLVAALWAAYYSFAAFRPLIAALWAAYYSFATFRSLNGGLWPLYVQSARRATSGNLLLRPCRNIIILLM